MIETFADLLLTRGGYDLLEHRSWSGPGTIEQWPSLANLDLSPGLAVNTHAGEWVSEHNALKYMAVYASVRILSLIDAALPLHVYRDRPGGGKDKAISDYRYKLLHDQPNEEMTAAQFRMYMRQNRCLWGNAYALLKWNRAMRLEAIWPLRPDWMMVYRTKSGRKVYAYDPPDGLLGGYYSPDEILHFRGLGDDLVGYSPIKLARQSIGLGMAAETFGATFFRNGARHSGILELAGRVRDLDEVGKKFSEKYAGAGNAGKVLVVDQGSKFVSTTIPPEDAQYLETRQFQSGEISAKIYGVPPHLTGDTEKQTSWGTGVEQMSIGFVTYTIMPECVLQEHEINVKILGNGLYCKYSLDGLLRADAKSRAETLQIERRNGVITADEWRELNERNPIEGGSELIVEKNMVPLRMLGQIAATEAQPKSQKRTTKKPAAKRGGQHEEDRA